jgi:alanine racemase
VSAPRAVARVRLGAVERNCARLASALAGGATLCAVVKADGYGHGAGECGQAALRGGASWLAVATAGEAASLRQAGLECRILVMGSLGRDDVDVALGADADVVAWEPGFVEALAARGAPARVHVKLDTGMGRLGTADPRQAAEVARMAAAAESLELAGIMTHFATADEVGDDHFPLQLRRFEEFAGAMRAEHEGLVAHAANSAATLRDPAAHFDMVRCGVATYGLDPFQSDPHEQGLEPALELHSRVGSVRRFSAGDSAGYGRAWAAPRDTLVATLPLGYGDGWRRALTNDCDVLIRGKRYPLVGRVSMDNVTIDLGPESGVEVGDPAVLIGEQGGERILCEEVARRLDTINYEVTCSLSARVPREHVR